MREFFHRFLAFFQNRRRDHDLDNELQFHLAAATDELIATGVPREEARRQAMLRFGGWQAAKELHRDARSLPFLECLAQDVRYTLRGMRREPGFTIFALLIIALGIGASTTVFSVLSTVLVRPLPFRSPSDLVWIANAPPPTKVSLPKRCR